MPAKNFKELMNVDITHNGFTLNTRDAVDTSKNISIIFLSKMGFFSMNPKPIHINQLKREYHNLCPDMEYHFPGVVDKILQPEILVKLGYRVDVGNMVHYN